MIKSEDISIIVQGGIIEKETFKCLKSIRKFLPQAEIILSTWDDCDVRGLDYDILVTNKIPFAPIIIQDKKGAVYNNMNRQLLSVQAGLKKAKRKYAMKLRSDLILTSNKFLKYFDKFQKRSNEYNLFERKILASALFTRFSFIIKFFEQFEENLTPFHVSDWWLFGLREDLNKYFLDTPLAEEPYFTNYFNLKENKNKKSPYGKAHFKLVPEQYFACECFARNFDDIFMEDAADVNEELMEKSRKCLVNNFIFLEFKQSGIYLEKYPYSKNEKHSGEQYFGLYNFYRYESEYKKYCNPDYSITTNDKLFRNKDKAYDILRIDKHVLRLFEVSTPFVKRIEQLLIGIPVSVILYWKNSLSGKYRKNK